MLTHTQKRLLLEAYGQYQSHVGRHWFAWENLEAMDLVTIESCPEGRQAIITDKGHRLAEQILRSEAAKTKKMEAKQKRLADFERRFAAKRVDA